MTQDNQTTRSRGAQAVMDAAIEATRLHAGARDLVIDVNEVFAGMGDALAVFAATVAQGPQDKEVAAEMLGHMETEIVTMLRMLAEKIRSGELQSDPPVRPKPRLVT